MDIQARKKVAFHTLGCKLNFAETSTMSRMFPANQFEKVPASQPADIYVINTCSVTDAADKKCRQAIKRFIHQAPDAFIAVAGCYAQLQPGEISAIPGVDLVLGVNEKFDIADLINHTGKKKAAEIHSCTSGEKDRFYHSWSAGDRTRSFLKVQDGCDYGCSYCTIPLARGKSRNADIVSLVSEAEEIASRGVKEIVITGVNIGDFGKSTGESFTSLIRELVRVPGIERYRISSIEPNLLTDELMELTAQNSKILPHLHIPLQSGCDKILGMMRRRYRREVFAERVRKIRELIPLSGIGADVIVGFPGETESDFEDTFSFIENLDITYLHVFTFSARPGTAAIELQGKVNHHEMERRSRKLISLSESKHLGFMNRNIGQEAYVLFEKTRINGMITGFTGNYLRVEYPWNPKLVGQVKKVMIKGVSGSGRLNIELTD